MRCEHDSPQVCYEVAVTRWGSSVLVSELTGVLGCFALSSPAGTRDAPSLAALSHSRAKTMAPCLTPGCAKYDFHMGPCTKDEMIEQAGKRSRSTVPRYEAGAAPPPSLLHAVVAAQGILPSDVSIYSPRTEAPRKSEPRASGSQLSRKLQYPSKEDDGENENDDDDAEEEEEEEEVEGDDADAAMSTALPSPGSVALQRMALLQQEVDQIKRDHGRPIDAAVVAPAKKSALRRGRSSEPVGALSAEPRTSGSKRSRRLPPPSGLAEPAEQSRCDDDGGEGGGEGGEEEEACPADHLIVKDGQCGAPACYNAVLVCLLLRLAGTRGFALGCSTRLLPATQTSVTAYGAVLRAATPAPPPVPLRPCHLSPYCRAARRTPVSASLPPPHYLPTPPPHRICTHCLCQGHPPCTVPTSRHARLHTARLPRGTLRDGGPVRGRSAAASAAHFLPVRSLACA